MRLAIVHYHLEPGGVTSVIAAASRAMGYPHVILSGGMGKPSGLPVRYVPGLGYLQIPGSLTAEELLSTLRGAARDALGGPPDIWHFHNPFLGKNVLFPRLIQMLVGAGERLVFHMHDLAEDGRPQNYQNLGEGFMYPMGPNVHYAFINPGDRKRFILAGLPEAQARLVRNPVAVGLSNLPEWCSHSATLLFAPIRGIRRKNLGELVLLSSLLPAGASIAISRAPQNKRWLEIHDHWKDFAAALELPVLFAAVTEQAPFESWIARSTHFVTTSIAEGCGLPFLESLAYGRPILGRDLSKLNGGLEMGEGWLYQHILVPEDWINEEELQAELQRGLRATYQAYQRPLPADACAKALQFMRHGDCFDFSNLPESHQKMVIQHPQRDSLRIALDGRVHSLKEWLAESISRPFVHDDLPDEFTPESHVLQLKGIYQQLLDAPEQPAGGSHSATLAAAGILDLCLAPEAFHFLRADAPPPPVRAIIFDLYGTLLLAPPGAARPDPAVDPAIRKILTQHGHTAPASPSRSLYEAVLRHHAESPADFPEVDLRLLWREILQLSSDVEMKSLVTAIEQAWHPARLMPGVKEVLDHVSECGIHLGILSNAQCNSMGSLGGMADYFNPELVFLSYQHGIAKPSPVIFKKLCRQLDSLGILPIETLFIGNDPIQDIQPASVIGFQTALYTGHPDSKRPGRCQPDYIFKNWQDLLPLIHSRAPVP